jgi:ribosomal protein S18 acetylase RimI-like enzyme
MIIRRVRKEDVPEIVKLVKKTFKRFIAPTFTKKAAQFRIAKIAEKSEELVTKEHISFVALIGKTIVGVVDGRIEKRKGHIRWLFVDKRYHKQGIGKILMDKIESVMKKKVKVVKLNASIYALDFYHRIGYKKTRGIVNRKGAYTHPMKKVLRS